MSSQPLLSSSALRKQQRRRARPQACGPAALGRIVALHRRLNAGEALNAESFAAELEVSSRTIKRDIDLMRDQLGVPIAWDAAHQTYYYTRHCDLLPLLRIDADEALALALAGKTFAAWGTSPLGRALSSALGKVASIVGGSVSLPAEALSGLLFTPDDPAAEAEHRHFALLLEAIHRRRELRIVYQKPRADAAPEPRLVHPLHLAFLEHRWMLVAHDPARRGRRHFVLARIGAAELTGRQFEPPRDFDLQRYLRGSLGRFAGDTEHEVRLLLDATVAPYLRERPWHPSQQIAERADGSIEVTLRLNNLIDIERRILACGAHVEVLAPPALRTSIRTAAAALLARHAPEKK
jgi:predicted DNA-binding transcriptional regulator YafY